MKFKVGDKVIHDVHGKCQIGRVDPDDPIGIVYKLKNDTKYLCWTSEDMLECDHQSNRRIYGKPGDPFRSYSTQCGRYYEIEETAPKPDPQIKVGQVWRWLSTGRPMTIVSIKESGNVECEYENCESYCYDIKPYIEDGRLVLVKDVPIKPKEKHFPSREDIENEMDLCIKDFPKKGLDIINDQKKLMKQIDDLSGNLGSIGTFTNLNFELEREKMNAPETKLEKKALAEAKNEMIEKATAEKKAEYQIGVKNFVYTEKEARRYRAEADELKKVLGLTKAEIDELI